MFPTSVSPAGKLSVGSCRCLQSKSQPRRYGNISKHRQSEEPKVCPVADIPAAVLIMEKDSPFMWLCRWSCTGFSVSVDDESILCFHQSVSVHGINLNQQDSSSSRWLVDEIFTNEKESMSAYALETSLEEIPCFNEHAHKMIKRKLINNDELRSDYAHDYAFALFSSLAPVQSLVVKMKGFDFDAVPNPLQQASWKRQLVGRILLYREGTFTSTIQLRDSKSRTLSLCIESLAARSSSSQVLFVVLPSTRISLVQSSADTTAQPLTLPQTFPTGISSMTKQLLHTIICTHEHIPVPRTFLLSGPAGVGKTYSVRKVLELCPFPVQLVSLRGSEVLQTHSNAALALERQFLTVGIDATKISLVFLDECDALVSVETVATMLATLLDKVASHWNHLIVIAATNRIDSLPGYLRRAGRFDKEIPMAPPNAPERADILLTLVRQQVSSEDTNDSISSHMTRDLQQIADLCVGYVPADLNALVRRATLLAAEQCEPPGLALVRFLEEAMSDVGPSALRDASISAPPKITWNDIAGDPGGAKTALQQAIEWPRTKAAAFARLGLVPPRGILLHGPPGCAKTTLARAAAGASGVAFLSLSPAEVYSSSYVGEAEAVVRRAFSLARSAAPCVLFFDELDSIFGGAQDGGRGNSAEARVLSTFLNEMDGVDNNRGADGVLVLGATNRPWTLDSALLRPGRLGDKIIYVPPPDGPARRAILEMQFNELRHNLDLEWLASYSVTGNMTGAELVGACQEAKLRVLRNLTEEKVLDQVIQDKSLFQVHLVDVIKSKKTLLSDPKALLEFRLFEKLASRQ